MITYIFLSCPVMLQVIESIIAIAYRIISL
jgi:hypothetical protein